MRGGDAVGYAKYHEDDAEVYFERMDNLHLKTIPNALPNYSKPISKLIYSVFCPFCRMGFVNSGNLIDHILRIHGGVHDFVYLNNQKITSTRQTVSKVFSLKLYSFREESREVQIFDNMGNKYSLQTRKSENEYDLLRILNLKPFAELHITNIDNPICITQYLDIKSASINSIISGKYQSFLFDEQFSEEKLSLEECLIYIKMLINEGSETNSFIERIDQMHFDDSATLREIYYYHFLHTGCAESLKGKLPESITAALGFLLNGDYQNANTVLSSSQGRSNDKYGCQLILSLLNNDKLGIDYLTSRYDPSGLIGILVKVLQYYVNYDKDNSTLITQNLDELTLFKHYPLILALVELYNSMNRMGTLSYDSYSLLRQLTPLAAIHYCYSIDDSSVKEKILRSTVKIHKNSSLLKKFALENNYEWIKRRIFVSDGDLYKKAVLTQNNARGNLFSQKFMEDFPFDDQIQITPLGGDHEIGASCFIISYKGNNVMLDCGINANKYGDSAYPALDLWNNGIDAIIISHAHIDHSGGVPKAHVMWPEAKVIATSPTIVFLKYLYSDMAKARNGITDEFEIENIIIEKEVMVETLSAMSALDYGEWFQIDKDFKIRLHPAGHIIGAAMIELEVGGKTILYTGDYCNYNQALTSGYDLHLLPKNADYLITETTYIKKDYINWNQQLDDLKNAIMKAIKGNESILLPSASIGRSQELVCLIGEMKLSGEIPNDVPLYIAGMAIPSTTQIIPFMNERYERIIGLFEEYNREMNLKNNAIVIASSGAMNKASASYRIARNWSKQHIRFTIIANGYFDDDYDENSKNFNEFNNIHRFSLSTHADLNGIINLIEYVSPKVISFVHRGTNVFEDIKSLEDMCKSTFSNDILCRDLWKNRCTRIFDMYEYFMEGVMEDAK